MWWDIPWGPPNLLDNGYRAFFTGIRRLERGVDHPPPSSAEVKERVELHLYSLGYKVTSHIGGQQYDIVSFCRLLCSSWKVWPTYRTIWKRTVYSPVTLNSSVVDDCVLKLEIQLNNTTNPVATSQKIQRTSVEHQPSNSVTEITLFSLRMIFLRSYSTTRPRPSHCWGSWLTHN